MRISLLLIVFALALVACKSGRRMTAVEPVEPYDYEFVDADPEPDPEPVLPPTREFPVVEESFKFEKREDEVTHEINRFFVILGSFKVHENANRFRTQLAGEGFNPVILLSETGFNRVSVDSYSREIDARQRVLQIRRTYPRYHDAWLLIRR